MLHEDAFCLACTSPRPKSWWRGPGTKVVVDEETLVATPGQTMVSKGAAGSE